MVTRWQPDTCECIIEYNEDGTLSNVVNACDAHQGDDQETVYQNVKEENPRKNKSFKEILDNAPAALYDIDPDSGQRVFKPGINVEFDYSGVKPNRMLSLRLKGTTLSASQIKAIEGKLHARFGQGKVTLVQG